MIRIIFSPLDKSKLSALIRKSSFVIHIASPHVRSAANMPGNTRPEFALDQARRWLEWSGFLESQARSSDRRELGFGCLAGDRRFALRPGTRLLGHSPQFHFLGHSSNRVAHLLDESLQIIRPDAEPLCPGANLCRIGH